MDFGLGDARAEGAQILTLASTDRLAVKLILLLPHQAEPEHKHAPVGQNAAKQEILRVVYGEMDVCTDGPGEIDAGVKISESSLSGYSEANSGCLLLVMSLLIIVRTHNV